MKHGRGLLTKESSVNDAAWQETDRRCWVPGRLKIKLRGAAGDVCRFKDAATRRLGATCEVEQTLPKVGPMFSNSATRTPLQTVAFSIINNHSSSVTEFY